MGPFYQSADLLELGPIDRSIYIDFVTGHFRRRGRDIEPDTVGKVYDMFEGNTYCMQKTLNESFADTAKGRTCTPGTTDNAVRSIISSFRPTYREILSNIPEKQKERAALLHRHRQKSREHHLLRVHPQTQSRLSQLSSGRLQETAGKRPRHN